MNVTPTMQNKADRDWCIDARGKQGARHELWRVIKPAYQIYLL